MPTSADHVLEAVFSGVLEESAFLLPESPYEAHQEVRGKVLRAEMGFLGPASGTLSLVVPMELAAQVVANQLGIEASDPEIPAILGDAMGELLNVTCNHFLTACWTDRAAFLVTQPAVEVVNDAEREAWLTDAETMRLVVNGHPLWLRLVGEQA